MALITIEKIGARRKGTVRLPKGYRVELGHDATMVVNEPIWIDYDETYGPLYPGASGSTALGWRDRTYDLTTVRPVVPWLRRLWRKWRGQSQLPKAIAKELSDGQ
jgi:hypothetical protein